MRKTGYLLLIPVFAALGLVEIYPLVYTTYLSLTNYSTGQFVGASNFAQMFSTSPFFGTNSTYLGVTVNAVSVSLFYAVGSTAISLVLGILLALQLSQLNRRKWLFECIFLAPLAAAPLVVGVAWAPSGMWDDFNAFWHFVLGQPFFNPAAGYFYYPVMIFSDAWEWAPLIMLVALGIMAGLPRDIYEAATLHGASTLQVFRRIYLPAILKSPVMAFIVTIRFIDAMRAFEIPFAWSAWVSYPYAGSPVDTLSLLLFKLLTTFGYGFPIGYVSAVSILLLVATLAFAALMFKIMTRTVKL